MKKRIRNSATKVIAVSATGNIISRNIDLPKKNVYIRNKQDPYKVEDREKYKEFSKSIENKVKAFKALKSNNDRLETLVRKNCAIKIADSLNRVIINSK